MLRIERDKEINLVVRKLEEDMNQQREELQQTAENRQNLFFLYKVYFLSLKISYTNFTGTLKIQFTFYQNKASKEEIRN